MNSNFNASLQSIWSCDLLTLSRNQAGGRSEGRAQPVAELGVFALGFVRIAAPALESSAEAGADVPDLRKRYWGRHFWARGNFSTTSGNITDDVILQYLKEHEPTGVSR